MAKTEKYSSVISIKADADFEQLINSIKKVQSNLQANPHTKSQDFLGIDQSLNKIAQLQEKMRLLREQGFSSPRDVQTYQRAMQDLLNEANEIQASFKNIHFKGLDREINEVEKALKKAQTTITSIQSSLKKTASQGLSKILNKTEASNYVAQLQQAGADADKISQIYSEINNKLDEQINKQKDLKATQQEIINQAKSGIKTTFNQKSFITNDNFDASKGTISSQAKAVFNTFLPSVANTDSAIDALNKFKVKLEEIGLVFTKNSVFNSANINKNPLLGIFETLRSSGGATNLAEATAKLTEVDSVLANLNSKKNLLKELFEGANFTGLIDQLQKGIISEQQFKEQLEQLTQLKINQTLTPDILQVNQELSKSKQNAENFSNSLTSMSQSQVQFDKLTTTIGNSVKRLLSFTTAWQTLRRVLRSTFNDIKALDKAFGSIAMVTNYSVSDMWQQYGTYAEMANKLGQTTQSVIEASGLYYQQGLETVEVMSLTEETMKLATLAGLDFKEATSQMTAALRAFHMEMDQGAHVTDVYATLAANAAVDVAGISDAMSATAAIAHSAGMSFENTAAMLTTMVEATQEAPKNLGTAMKAIIARFTELKNSVAGTDQSEFADLDYNKVDKALKSVGISIKDATGQFRNLDEVFLELSGKWNSLDRNTQRYIATIAAGSRQQSRFIALMENYDRTMDLIETAQDSAGKADKQFAKYSDTIEFKLNRLKNAWEQTKTTIFNSDFYGDLLDVATKVVEKLEGLDWKRLLVAAPAAIAAGRLMGKTWADNFTQGAGMVRNFFGGQGVGKNKGLTARELQTNYREGKKNLSQELGQKVGRSLGGKEVTQGIEKLNQLRKEVEEATKQRIAAQEEYDKSTREQQIEQSERLVDSYDRERQAQENLQQAQEQGLGDYSRKQLETFELLRQQRKDLWKKQAWSSAASAAGMAAGTALTMAMMGTFDASQIANMIAIQTATTAVSQFASGNWLGGLISAGIGAASFGLGKLFDYLEEEEEKHRLAINQVYAHEKAIEKLEEKQETLNQELDKQNAIYDETKEKYDNFKNASETYEELSTKIALTDEEQEKLNEATQELANMHPELIQGYDDQGNAILSMGEAWNKAAEAEKAYWNQVRKDQADAEIKSIENEYQLSKEYQGKDRSLKLQREELYSGRETTNADVYSWAGATQYKNINDLLNMETWDVNVNARWNDDVERYVEELIKDNTAFAEVFTNAYNKVMDANIKSAQTAYDEMFNGSPEEENARWAEMVDYIKEQFSLWEELDGIDLTEGTKKTTEALKKASTSTLNTIDILIGDSIENEDAKKQLLNQLRKSTINDEEIEKALEDGASGIDDFAEKIINDNQDLINQYKNVTPYQSQLIGEFFNNLNTVTIVESQKAIDKIKSSGVGENIIKGLEESLNDAIADSAGFTNQLKEYFGKGFEDSGISKIFEQLGISGKNAFIKRLAQFDDNDARIYSHAINDFIESNINIEPKVAQALIGIDWSSLGAVDIITERKNFAKLGEEWDISTQKMNDYFDQFKNNVASIGILDITSTALSTDALSNAINEDLKEIITQSSKISTAIKEQLTNGFLNFSQSQDLREACEKIGLNADDYLKQNELGLTMLDIKAMKKALEEQVLDENEILEGLKAQYQEKINQIDAQIAIIKGNDEEFNQLAKNIKLSGELAKNYRAAAAAAYALAHDSVDFKFDTADIVFDTDTTQVRHDAIDELLKIRDEYEKFIDKNLTPESDWWQSIKGNFASATYEIEKNIATAVKEGTLAESDLTTAEKERDDAVKALAKSTQDLEQKERALTKAEKELKEAYNGNPLHKNKLDSLNNYTTMLDEVASKAEKVKNKLDNLSKTDNVGQLLQTYTTEIHSEVVVRNAENDVIKQAMANAEATLSEYSEYWYKIGEQYYINYNKLNAAAMPDDLSDEIENQIEQLRNWRKELENNNDAIDKLRKDFEETQKQALQNYVNLEKEVVETLKEQYQKEVDDLQDKYSAMKDADDDYLNALEKAINKERDLRNRQNQWDDLAKKEKRLSLMQRDTSGSQQVEALKLQEEIEKDRTQLFDDSVDDIVDSLKEMYELQQESRDAEIEYMNSMLENANLINEANAIISGWTTAEDAVNWFLNAKDLTQMSTAELELEKKSWEELYNAKRVYDEQSKIDFDKYLEVTQSEISEYVQQLSETATTESERAIAEIKQKIIEAQIAAEDAYKSAQQNLTDAQDAWDKAKKAAEAARTYFELLKKGLEEAGVVGSSEDSSSKNPKPTNINITDQEITKTRNNFLSNSDAINYSNQIAGEARAAAYIRENNSSNKGDYSLKTSSNYDAYVLKRLEWSERNRSVIQWYGSSPLIWSLDDDAWKDSNINSLSKVGEALAKQGYHGYINDNKIYIYDKNVSVPYPTVNSAEDARKMKGYSKFAQGGLVDYTGPAWVDGSPSNPEAFLSVDDTRLIGNLVNLLSNIPSLNPNTNPTQFSTSNIGDTTINLTVNFDSVSEDYDADRVIDLMKEKIVEAANYTGANIILNKR